MAGKSQDVQLSSLTPTQLKGLHDQLDQEIQILSNSMQSLKNTQSLLMESKRSIASLKPKNLGKKILVPMTSSLFVPGTLSDIENVMVDIGTGYYVEKNVKEADEFFNRKVDYLKQQMDKVQPSLQNKFKTRQIVFDVLQSKILMQQKGQTEKK